ncbi:AbiJ-NTD4 domain-containing protein [Nocardia sp. KC 131]|uniref:AbiJ-NTD4 domain-containing protein n=1 Tax=Nocardia arseniciresistens TaxID=3392119 RepID=UPI00398E8CE8
MNIVAGWACLRHYLEMRFSQRHGCVPVKSVVQVEEIDDDLRTDLWNVTHTLYFEPQYAHATHPLNFTRIWVGLLRKDIDQFPVTYNFEAIIKHWFKTATWYEVYDLVEEFIDISEDTSDIYNQMLKHNLAGYRLLNKQIVPIADSHELTGIESALRTEKDVVKHHLQQAIRLLADRENPDYPNSIKESISAVESLLAPQLGENTLGRALAKMKKHGNYGHPVLLEAWSKLYGWTSDEDGIRHGGEAVPAAAITQELARYFLITCSAFINLMTANQAVRGTAGTSEG